ncbi:MAG: glucose-6-phosphate isomerase [Candidatus Azobacteroides pseudotrichonymphae]|jgi:glucose-6-phosphate isomerase|uniref:Glucose-6-phosphate isomerase n=1 Tax=Azobacteroides pseudotrichonymphae genomovar. CFP2 TaxID=511995 RepID=B6YRR5_AZOPC|nr:glucose-6-phosphate isomerase [Candidatus Azobacteroides pseudotrichonymphae]BAG83887.1 glucose-6-phosphate isomerase [Candidatus Azobacteroides pseudotrichonymphae genomovar. CFP2]GMO33082.1 MAG: glucose-6-phosphate isomerase [Candidatus Azobacteroides pseudotrichonymphae]
MKLDIKLSSSMFKTLKAMTKEQVVAQAVKTKECNRMLEVGNGKGRDFLGWLHFPSSVIEKDMDDIQLTANSFRTDCEVVVIVGIGGSYLGARAVITALANSFGALKNERPVVVYAGHNISEDYLYELSEYLEGKKFGIINISKSGTTTEPALAFRILKKQLEDSIGKMNAQKHIVAVTDKARGALHNLAVKEKYKTYIIPDDIGGRFSVLTPVGLLPIAIAGINIKQLIAGATDMERATSSDIPFENNPAELYASTRNELYKIGKKIEILANFNPKLHYVAEWWKQLYSESEGKQHKGIFTAVVDFTTDLHSMGQWIQEAERTVFETVISIASPKYKVEVPLDSQDLDGLNFLSGKRVDYINKMAELGTQIAHVEGDVPNIKIELPELNEYHLGQLLYFFERACGISGYLLEVNPFDQPGVESYKKNMFALLNKPGFEHLKPGNEIRSKLYDF